MKSIGMGFAKEETSKSELLKINLELQEKIEELTKINSDLKQKANKTK